MIDGMEDDPKPWDRPYNPQKAEGQWRSGGENPGIKLLDIHAYTSGKAKPVPKIDVYAY
jgi:hypothetical protein